MEMDATAKGFGWRTNRKSHNLRNACAVAAHPLIKSKKLPNEPILDFAFEFLIQQLPNICAVWLPQSEPIFSVTWPAQPGDSLAIAGKG